MCGGWWRIPCEEKVERTKKKTPAIPDLKARAITFVSWQWEAEHPRCWNTTGRGLMILHFIFFRNYTNWGDPFYSWSSSAASLSTQPRDLSTALLQRRNHSSLVPSSVIGLNVLRSSRLMPLSSSNSFHIFTANPAAIAAPSAVVSRIWGRSTSIPVVNHSFWLIYW